MVYRDEIHIFGGGNSNRVHYKWDGTSWIRLRDIPYDFYNGSVVVYNDAIHLLGGSNSPKVHYKWDGTSWILLSSMIYDFSGGSAAVYNNELYILGTETSPVFSQRSCKWNEDTDKWNEDFCFPLEFFNGDAVTCKDGLYLVGRPDATTFCVIEEYENNKKFTTLSNLPYSFHYSKALVYKNGIYILGSYRTEDSFNFYKWNSLKWTCVESGTVCLTLPFKFYRYTCDAVVYRDEIHIFGGGTDENNIKHYKIRLI